MAIIARPGYRCVDCFLQLQYEMTMIIAHFFNFDVVSIFNSRVKTSIKKYHTQCTLVGETDCMFVSRLINQRPSNSTPMNVKPCMHINWCISDGMGSKTSLANLLRWHRSTYSHGTLAPVTKEVLWMYTQRTMQCNFSRTCNSVSLCWKFALLHWMVLKHLSYL